MTNTGAQQSISRKRGFTLAELLVVLAILAIMTAVAMQSLVPVANQARYDSTMRTLNNVSASVVAVNGSSISGFVADTGRLPSTSETVASVPLSVDELTGIYPSLGTSGPPSDLGNYQQILLSLPAYTSPTGTSTISLTISSGWNGPYLLAPSGSYTSSSATSVVDGWGQPLPAFLYPDASNGAGLTILSSGDPTVSKSVYTTLAPSQLTASQIILNANDSNNNPKTPTWGSGTYFYAIYGPAPNGFFSPPPSGAITAGIYQVQSGVESTSYPSNPAPAVYRLTIAFATSATVPSASTVVPPTVAPGVWLPTAVTSPALAPVLGQRVFCILDSNDNVVAGPLYRLVLPGTNTVQFLAQ